MSCIVLDIELADENVIKKSLEIFFHGKVQVYSFCPPKSTNTESKHFRVQENFTDMCGTVDVWITVSFPTFFIQMQRVNKLQTDQNIARFLPNYWIKR